MKTKRKVKKFVGPETDFQIRNFPKWDDPIETVRIIREKDYQALLRLAKTVKRVK